MLDVQEVTGSSPVPRTNKNGVDSQESTLFLLCSTRLSTHFRFSFGAYESNPYKFPDFFFFTPYPLPKVRLLAVKTEHFLIFYQTGVDSRRYLWYYI